MPSLMTSWTSSPSKGNSHVSRTTKFSVPQSTPEVSVYAVMFVRKRNGIHIFVTGSSWGDIGLPGGHVKKGDLFFRPVSLMVLADNLLRELREEFGAPWLELASFEKTIYDIGGRTRVGPPVAWTDRKAHGPPVPSLATFFYIDITDVLCEYLDASPETHPHWDALLVQRVVEPMHSKVLGTLQKSEVLKVFITSPEVLVSLQSDHVPLDEGATKMVTKWDDAKNPVLWNQLARFIQQGAHHLHEGTFGGLVTLEPKDQLPFSAFAEKMMTQAVVPASHAKRESEKHPEVRKSRNAVDVVADIFGELVNYFRVKAPLLDECELREAMKLRFDATTICDKICALLHLLMLDPREIRCTEYVKMKLAVTPPSPERFVAAYACWLELKSMQPAITLVSARGGIIDAAAGLAELVQQGDDHGVALAPPGALKHASSSCSRGELLPAWEAIRRALAEEATQCGRSQCFGAFAGERVASRLCLCLRCNTATRAVFAKRERELGTKGRRYHQIDGRSDVACWCDR